VSPEPGSGCSSVYSCRLPSFVPHAGKGTTPRIGHSRSFHSELQAENHTSRRHSGRV
jgi:hypothetical protein